MKTTNNVNLISEYLTVSTRANSLILNTTHAIDA